MGKRIVVLCILASIAFLTLMYFRNASNTSVKQIYKFTRLAPEIAAQSGKYQVLFQDVLDEHYLSLVSKQEELLLLAAIEQWVKGSTITRFSIQMSEPKRPLMAICAQYAIVCPKSLKIIFNKKQSAFFIAERNEWELKDLKTDTVPYMSTRTETLNYLLEKINENLRAQALLNLSKEEKITVSDWIAKNILQDGKLKKISDERWTQFVSVIPHSRNMTEEEQKAVYSSIEFHAKNEAIDDYLQDHFFTLPISVNIEKPSVKYDIRWDWTPFIGEQKTKKVPFVAFCDFYSVSCRQLLSIFPELSESWPQVTFGFRPFFQNQDRFQLMIAEMSMCVWSKSPQYFWAFMKDIHLIERKDIEEKLYSAVEKSGAPLESVKKCFLARETAKAVQYHLQSASYYRIINTPVIFIGNEVYVGPLSGAQLMNMIRRQIP